MFPEIGPIGGLAYEWTFRLGLPNNASSRTRCFDEDLGPAREPNRAGFFCAGTVRWGSASKASRRDGTDRANARRPPASEDHPLEIPRSLPPPPEFRKVGTTGFCGGRRLGVCLNVLDRPRALFPLSWEKSRNQINGRRQILDSAIPRFKMLAPQPLSPVSSYT